MFCTCAQRQTLQPNAQEPEEHSSSHVDSMPSASLYVNFFSHLNLERSY